MRNLWHWARPKTTVAQTAAACDAVVGHWLARDEVVMGTSIRVELWSDDLAVGEAAIDAVMTEMQRIDGAMGPHNPDSELSRINRDAHRAPVALSSEMFLLLVQAQRFAQLSQGAFDITVASTGGCAAVGWRGLELDARTRSVTFARQGMRIDLGGFARGHAVDSAAAILARHGIHHAHVAAGGGSRVIGDRRGRPWTIGVRDPRNPGALVALLPLTDTAISTSGDCERVFECDGMHHHPIVDPATGASPRDVRSVTVLAADGLTCEAMSRTISVLGCARGMTMVETLKGVDAIVVDAAGAVHTSSGMSAARTALRH